MRVTPGSPGRRCGVTLLELIIVLVILASALGLAIPLLMSAAKSLAVPSARTHLASLLRTARETALLQNTPAWVVIDTNSVWCSACSAGTDAGPAGGTTPCRLCKKGLEAPKRAALRQARLWARQRVVELHFEDMIKGASRTKNLGDSWAAVKAGGGGTKGAASIPGKVGLALAMDGRTTVETEPFPVFDVSQGVAIELWIKRDDGANRQALVSIGRAVVLQLEGASQSVRACPSCGRWIGASDRRCALCGVPLIPTTGVRRPGLVLSGRVGSARAVTGECVPSGWWVKIEMIYAAGELQLLLNDVRQAAVPAEAFWESAPLVAGDRSAGLRGAMDELSADVIIGRDPYPLSAGLTFELGRGARPDERGRLVIAFDKQGRLDPSHHAEPVELKIVTGRDREGHREEAQIVVDLAGQVAR